jgi:hypothetical protein
LPCWGDAGRVGAGRYRSSLRPRRAAAAPQARTSYQDTLHALPAEIRDVLLGGFKTQFKDQENQVIPTAWVKAAIARWRTDGWKGFEMTALALDPAGGGDDPAALAMRHGPWYAPIVTLKGEATPDGAQMPPPGTGIGVLEKLEPLERASDPRVRATYRTPTGERFSLDGRMEEFLRAGAFYDQDNDVIVLNFFGRGGPAGGNAGRDLVEGLGGQLRQGPTPGPGIAFDLAIRGLIAHESLHAFWRRLTDEERELLVRHANRLGVLEMPYQQISELTRWD